MVHPSHLVILVAIVVSSSILTSKLYSFSFESRIVSIPTPIAPHAIHFGPVSIWQNDFESNIIYFAYYLYRHQCGCNRGIIHYQRIINVVIAATAAARKCAKRTTAATPSMPLPRAVANAPYLLAYILYIYNVYLIFNKWANRPNLYAVPRSANPRLGSPSISLSLSQVIN